LENVSTINIENLKEKVVQNVDDRSAIAADLNNADWEPAFKTPRFPETAKAVIYSGTFHVPDSIANATITFFYNNIGQTESIYINGKPMVQNNVDTKTGKEFKITQNMLHPGKNTIAIFTVPFIKKNSWDYNNTNPGTIQVIVPAAQWKRKLFNGLAEVIIQSTGEPGQIVLTATSPALKKNELKIEAIPAAMHAAVASVDK
jgi:beta-galactosidase